MNNPMIKEDVKTVKISNSQIMDFQKCERRFYYSQVLKLKPKSYPLPMERGIFGHGCFELGFKAMQEGKSYDECIAAINPLIQANLDNPEYFAVYRHVCAFIAKAFEAKWLVISVEVNELDPLGYIQLPDGEYQKVEFAFTPDIVFQFTEGIHKGQYFMLDFKFTGQYWSDRELGVYQQLPKYSIYWKRLHPDKPIRQLGVAMMNTRAAVGATGANLFLIKWLKITKNKLERIQYENDRLVHRVAWAKKHYTPDEYLRTVDTFTCKMCFFGDDLCPAELEGRPTETIITRNYELNTYFDDNYEKEAIDKMEKKAIEQ